jgi:succinate dehydrogenase / fumarate reductase membrane anchor subunit
MKFITDRKRAVGRGASGTGTETHWYMTVTGAGLALVLPFFIYIFGSALGQGHEEVLAIFSRPVPAILTAIVLVMGLNHYQVGAQIMIEDYVHGLPRKITVIAVITFSYILMAAGLFALAKIAL